MRLTRNTPHEIHDNPNLGQVVGHMQRFARQGAYDMEVRGLVEEICGGLQSGDYAGEVLACYYWVCQNIRYLRDPTGVELVKIPRQVIKTRTGDCDDMATLLAAMLLCTGNRCRFALVGFSPGAQPSHVFVEVLTPGGWTTLDPVANRDTKNMLARVRTMGSADV